MASLNQVRESLVTLESYKLPERYEPIHESNSNSNSINNNSSEPLLDPQTIQRYRAARAKYLTSSINTLIVEHLATIRYERPSDGEEIDYSTPIIDLPLPPTQEEEQALNNQIHAAKENLIQSVNQVKQSYEGVRHKYQLLQSKKADLHEILDSIPSKEGENIMDIDGIENENNGDDDNIMERTEMAAQDDKMTSLKEKRSVMEARLRKIRMETEQVSHDIDSKQILLQTLVQRHSHSHEQQHANPDAVLELDTDIEMLKKDSQSMRMQAQDFRDMSDYYESTKGAIEVISGIKIISVTDAKPTEQGSNDTVSPRKSSPRKQFKDQMSADKERAAGAGTIVLKVQLLDQHIVEIALRNCANGRILTSSNNSNGHQDSFRVVSATLVTSSVLTDTLLDSEEREKNPTPTVSVTIPPLDDLVSLATNLDPMQDLMFVLREALARIRILSARMNELALLRQKYLTKITDSAKNKIQYGFGGEDQEIFCSLGSQVTVVLRLTNDCPILKGSVYIQRIVGCGGWEENVLQKMKVKVNEMKMSGPVELMDALVEEIERIVEEEGVKMPKTPVLPSRRN
eukprot:scaffold10175_cov268-Chaetoceros_neogracile.AAC.20